MLSAAAAADKLKEESETHNHHFEELKTLIKTVEAAEFTSPEELVKLTEFSEDPYFSSLLADADQPDPSGFQNSLADAIHHCCCQHSKLTPS